MFVSTLWFVFSLGLSIQAAFGSLGQNAQAHDLALGLLLAWLPALPMPRALGRVTVLLASASMHIYLVHWLVYPPLASLGLPLALAASLAAGVAYWALCNKVAGAAHRLLARK